jgi:hypothetical protein
MFVIPDEARSPILDHLRVTDKMLRLIHHLSYGPASCDPQLIGAYVAQAMSHLQAAERLLNERKQEPSGDT